MTLDVWLDIVAGTFLVAGAFLSFIAGVGIVHFPDLLARMHAGTKPQVLGMLFMLVGLAVRLRSWSVAGLLLLVILFQMLTAPVGAHMVARAGYRTGKVHAEDLEFDELTEDTERHDGPAPGPTSNRT
ncbi:MAG: monovalent cation/H(+) antiporter subunit G [Actinomycetales bacterium]|nr:monovalent cation/H(+) antiporter subunit G [Actinomycetales bacterium]